MTCAQLAHYLSQQPPDRPVVGCYMGEDATYRYPSIAHPVTQTLYAHTYMSGHTIYSEDHDGTPVDVVVL